MNRIKAGLAGMMVGATVSLLAMGVAMSAMMTGCTTTQTVTAGANGGPPVTNTTRVVDVDTTCALVAAVGTPLMPSAVQKCPECRTWFAVAANVIGVALHNGTLDPATIQTALAAAKLPANDVEEVQAVTEALLGVYQVYAGKVVQQKLDQTRYLVPVLTAIQQLLAAGAASPSGGP